MTAAQTSAAQTSAAQKLIKHLISIAKHSANKSKEGYVLIIPFVLDTVYKVHLKSDAFVQGLPTKTKNGRLIEGFDEVTTRFDRLYTIVCNQVNEIFGKGSIIARDSNFNGRPGFIKLGVSTEFQKLLEQALDA